MTVRCTITLVTLLQVGTLTFGQRVLIVSGRDTGSHQESMRPYFEALARANFTVTVFDSSNAKVKTYDEPNVDVVNFYIARNQTDQNATLKRFIQKPYRGFSIRAAQQSGNDYILDVLEQYGEKFLALTQIPFDLVVIDDMPCVSAAVMAMLLRRLHNTKVVIFSTTKSLDYFWFQLGLVRNPATSTYIFTFAPESQVVFDVTDFQHRLFNIIPSFQELLSFLFIDESQQLTAFHSVGLKGFHWNQLYQHIGLSVIDSVDHNKWPIAKLPLTQHTGLTCGKEPGSLDDDLKMFLEDTKSLGTIYIAFGTYIDLNFAHDQLMDAVVNGIQRLDKYRVVVSFKGDKSRLPQQPYIRYLDWAPQAAILRHHTTKVFVTHGGLKSIKEGMCAKIPLVVMPIFAEQNANGHFVKSTGIGEVLNKFTVDEYTFANAVTTVATDVVYKNTMVKLVDSVSDRLIPDLDQVVELTKKFVKQDLKTWLKFRQVKGVQLPVMDEYYIACLLGLIVVSFVAS